MLKGIFTLVCIFSILVPSASAQSSRPINITPDDVVLENLCVAGFDDGFQEAVALNDSQQARLRIELLERGLDPGFDLAAADADAKLTEAIRMFQEQSLLPVTGQADAATLFMLSVPTEDNGRAFDHFE